MDKYEEIFAKLEDYCEKWIVLLDTIAKDWREKEEQKQMQIQEINLFPNQDSCQSNIDVDVEETASTSEEESSTMPNSETLTSTIDSPIQPVHTVQLLIPTLELIENMHLIIFLPIHMMKSFLKKRD